MEYKLNTDYYRIYKDNTINLVKTMTIKSIVSAEGINTFLDMTLRKDTYNINDPTTWKYYLNISGEYHNTDIRMFITSLDDGEYIEFNKVNLAKHPVTASSYVYGTRYYFKLLIMYPEQEQLILGILYPCNINTAIAALDGTILSYQNNLIEVQEETLIYDLNNWIQFMLLRWNVSAYAISDNLYPALQHATLYTLLVLEVFNQRLARCKTREVHSFHIMQHLASHGGLDVYYEYLTLEQALFLYRNIEYIERNPGTNDTFNLLIKNLVNNTNIPLTEYSIRHKGTFDLSYKNDYIIKPNALNNNTSSNSQKEYTLKEILFKELNDGADTNDYINHNTAIMDKVIRESKSNVLETKILESYMTDYSDNSPLKLKDTLFNHWCYLSNKNYYRALISFNDPTTNNIITLNTQDAFIFLIYLTSMSLGKTFDIIPKYTVNRVQKLITPNLTSINNFIDKKYLIDDVIGNWLVNNQPIINDIRSSAAFFNIANKIYLHEQKQLLLIANQQDAITRSMVMNMVNYFYDDYVIDFRDSFIGTDGIPTLDLKPNGILTGTSFPLWLKRKSLTTEILSYNDCVAFIENITNAALGVVVDHTKMLVNIQNAVINIMRNLTSYSLQYINNINSSSLIPIGYPAIRITNIKGGSINKDYLNISNIEPIAIHGSLVSKYSYNVIGASKSITSAVTHVVGIDITNNFKMDTVGYKANFIYNIPKLLVNANYALKNNLYANQNNLVIGYEYFAMLTDIQKLALKDMYNYK